MQRKLFYLFIASLLSFGQASAEVQINGFASVVTGIDLEDEGQSSYGSRTADNLQDSKVALQWSADLGEGIRFVGQTMAKGDAADGFQLSYDWAYFDFNIGSSAKLKLGRLRIPFYKYSDYLDVGYAYHWISPPESMYSLPFSDMDGVGYQQNFQAMNMDHSLNFVLGSYQGNISLGGDTESKLENLFAINWSAAVDNHEFYIAYARADVYIPASDLSDLSGLSANPRDVLIDGDAGSFVGAGYKGSFGDLSIFSEYSIVKVDDSIFYDTQGGYIGAAYALGEYTYHLTYGFSSNDEKSFTGGNADTDIGIANAAPASGSTLNSVARDLGNGEDTTITIGIRKDIGATSAIKVDLDLYTEDRIQTDQVTAVSEEKSATVLKFAVETMF